MNPDIWSTTPGKLLPQPPVSCSVTGEKEGRVWVSSADGLPFIDITCGGSFKLGGPLYEWETLAAVLLPALEQARIASRLKTRLDDRAARELRQREDRASEEPS